MTIDTQAGGLYKPNAKNIGILWAAPAGLTDASKITAATDLAALDFDNLTVSEDGIPISPNSEEGEVLRDFNGNPMAVTDSKNSTSVTFTMLELATEKVAKMAYASGSVTVGADGYVTSIDGDAAPGDKILVFDGRLNGFGYRIVLPRASFSSRGDETLTPDKLAGWEVTYTALADGSGHTIYRRFAPRS